MIKRHTVILASALLAGAIFTSPVFSASSKAYAGNQLFNTTCFLCHGKSGKGDGPLAGKLDTPVTDLTNGGHVSQLSDRELFRIIQGTMAHGTVNKSMPRWGLAISEPQIHSLVAYIRFLHRSKHELAGDPELGKKVYQKNCATCHGRDGKGDGALTNVITMSPADHTDGVTMNQISNEQMRKTITIGSTGKGLMPGWKDLLSDAEIDGLISYIRLLSKH
ncbi:MAG: c-type cytochrome [Chromatiales bacterium]